MRLRKSGLGLAALLMAVWCGSAAAAEHVLRLGTPFEIVTLDPHLHTLAAERVVTTMMLDGLLREDATGEPMPAGAESWDISSDGRRYVFHLRPTAKFSDGRPVTADDYVYAFRRYVDPKTHSRSTGAIESILHARDCLTGKLPPDALGVTATDRLTLTVVLSHPSPFFLHWSPLLVPLERDVIERWGDQWTAPGHMVSNGPFTLAGLHPGGAVELVKNPSYWNEAAIRLDRIELIPLHDRDQELAEFQAGRLDAVILAEDQIADQADRFTGQIKTQPVNRIAYYFFNLAKAPFTDQKGLRRALSLSLETETVARRLGSSTEEPANSFIPRNFSAYAHPRLDFAARPMAARLLEARRLYGEAHYGPEHPLSFNLVEGSQRRCQIVADMWKTALGAEVTCTIIENPQERFAAYRRGDFDVGLMIIAAAAPDPLELLESFQSLPFNPGSFGGYRSIKFDDLLLDAANSSDFLSRAEKLAQAERVLLDDLPAMPLAYSRVAYMVGPRVRGFRMLPSGSMFVDDVTFDDPAE
jgi:oligopeptide transport system substrate-binding protein